MVSTNQGSLVKKRILLGFLANVSKMTLELEFYRFISSGTLLFMIPNHNGGKRDNTIEVG